jgi:hypothetical protein
MSVTNRSVYVITKNDDVDTAINAFTSDLSKHHVYLQFLVAPNMEDIENMRAQNSHVTITLVKHDAKYNSVCYPELSEDELKSGLFFGVSRKLCCQVPPPF